MAGLENPLRFLLVYGDPDEADIVRALVGEGLPTHVGRVETTADAGAAVASVRAAVPDVVLVDSRLAGGGVDAVSRLRLAGYEGPVVFLADAHCPEEEPAAIRAGATVTVAKPSLSAQALATLVEQARDINLSERRARAAEAERRRTEALFRALFEASADLVVILGTDLGVRLASPSSGALLGVTPEALAGRGLARHLDAEELPRLRDEVARLLSRPGGEVATAEVKLRRADGQWRRFEATGRNLHHDPLVQGVVVTLRDVTASRLAESALRESERRYRLLFNAIPDAIFVHEVLPDGTLGPFSNVNDEAARRLGYTRDELLRLTPVDLDDPASGVDRAPIVTSLCQGLPVTFDQVHVARDGRRIPVEVHAHAIVFDGRPSVLSIVRDVSERQRIRADLEAARRRLAGVFEASPVPLFITDRQARFVEVNRAFRETFGYSREEMTTVPGWMELAYPDPAYRAELAAARALRVEQARRTGRPTETFTARIRCKDGSERWTEIIDSPLGDDTLVVFDDVTERRLSAEAVARSETRLRALFESAPIGIAVSRDGLLLQVNPAFAAMFGCPAAESVVGTRLVDHLAPGDRERLLARNRARETGEDVPSPHEAVGQRRDGTTFPFRIDASRLDLPEGVATLAFLRDVTHEKLIQGQLEERERRYHGLFANTRDPIFILRVHPDGRVVHEDSNPAHAALVGQSAQSLVGRTLAEILPAEFAPTAEAHVRRVVETGSALSFDDELELPSGAGTFRTQLLPLGPPGGPVDLVAGIVVHVGARR